MGCNSSEGPFHKCVEKVDAMKEQERKKGKDFPVSQLIESKAHAQESANEGYTSRGSGDENKKKKKKKILEDKSSLKDDNQIKKKINHSPSVDNKEIARDGVDGKPSTSSPASNKTKSGKEKKRGEKYSMTNTLEGPPFKNLEEKTVGVVNGKVNNDSPEEEAGLDGSEVSRSKKKRKKEEKSILDDRKASTKKKKRRVSYSGEVEVDDTKEQERKKENDCSVSQLLESKAHAKESVKERNLTRGSSDEKNKKNRKIVEDESRLKDKNQIKKKIKLSSSVDHKEIVRDGVNGKPSMISPASIKTNPGKDKKSKKNNSMTNTPERPPNNNMEEKTVGVVNGKVNNEISSAEKEVGIDESEVSSSRKKRKREKKSILDDKKTSTKKKKRVSFSGEVEVFSPSDNTDNEEIEENLVQGKRFTPEEDDILREAIAKYIEAQQLGVEGEHMVLHCKDYKKIKGCWKTIAASLPHRPRSAVYHRGHSLLERSEKPKWTPEEYDMLRRLVQEHGRDWRKIGDMLGKYRFHVKDAWRRIGSPSYKKGAWSQDEYQALFDLVNFDLKMKVNEVKESKHGMLKDNIHWEAISTKLSTRYNASCCLKWYRQLTSPLVTKGLWSDGDDYLLIDVLQKVDACCEDDIDWDNLLDHRSGDICRTRWNEMVRHIGGVKEKTFIEQLEVLSKRYSSEMIEYRK